MEGDATKKILLVKSLGIIPSNNPSKKLQGGPQEQGHGVVHYYKGGECFCI